MDEGEVAAQPSRRWPCVILLPNGEGHQKEAKVFPLAKAPTFDRLLVESSNRFAREITRIFVVLPEHQPHPAEGGTPVTELNNTNYVDVCTRLPPRCVLYVSRGEPFHHNAVAAPPPPTTQPRADEVAQEMDMTTEVAVTDELRPVVERQKEEDTENEEKEDDQNEGEPRETHHLLVMAKKNERTRSMKTRPNSRDLELQRQQKRASRDFREDEFLSQLRRVRLSAPQVKTVNWSNMAMSTMPDWHQNWTAIEEVQMHHNNFTSFPMKIVDEPNFRHIKILNLSYNRIPRLPDEFLLLQGLTSLNLTCNKLTSCYPALLLPSLTELDLSENCLSVITRRDILHPQPSHNNAVDDGGASSPQVAAHALTSLSLNLNLLESLPVEMEHLSSLRYLYVKDNPFKPPLHKLNNAGNQAIMLHFLADLLSESPGSPSANRNRTLSGSFSAREAIAAGGLAIIPIEELALDVSASPLGRGAHGVVWRGTYQGQTVAVKNVSSIAKFCQEVGILSSLKLKYCIKYYGVCVVSGITLVVMEYAPMADLGKVLKDLRHNLTLAEKVRIALKVAKGMEELHRAGILHCDLKCKNILVFETNPWKIKLNDFGLSTQYKVAHCAKAPSSDATMYFPCTAPEVLENQPFSMKSDVYSYAMFLYELFTGRKPFKGLTIDEIVRLVTKGSRPPLAHLDKSSQRPSTPAPAATSSEPPPIASPSSPPSSRPEDSKKPPSEQLHLPLPTPSPISPASTAPQSTSPRSRSPGSLSSSTAGRVLQPAEVKEMLLRAHKVARRKKDFVGKHELEGLLSILADFTHQRSSSSSLSSSSSSSPSAPSSLPPASLSASSSSISPITESVLEKMMERAQAMIHHHSDSHFPLSPNYAEADEEQEEGEQALLEQSADEIAESEARQHVLRKIRRIIEKCWSGRPHQRPSFSEIVSKVSQIYWKGSKGTRSRTGWISGNERLTFSLLCKKANGAAIRQALAHSNNSNNTSTSTINKDQL